MAEVRYTKTVDGWREYQRIGRSWVPVCSCGCGDIIGRPYWFQGRAFRDAIHAANDAVARHEERAAETATANRGRPIAAPPRGRKVLTLAEAKRLGDHGIQRRDGIAAAYAALH